MSLLPPVLLHYYITERCNCRCSFCQIWRNPQRSDAELSMVLKRLTEAKALGVRFVDFTGGEPLLHLHLPEMLRAAHRLCLKTTLTTNALLYRSRAHELKGYIDFLHFSVDAAEAETHNRLRHTDVFHHVLASLDLARSLGEQPDLLFTVTESNLDQLPRLSRIAETLQLLLIVNPVFSHRYPQPLSSASLDFIQTFAHHPYVYVNHALLDLRRRGGNQIDHPRCRAMDSVIVITPDDHLVVPCYHFAQDHRPISRLAAMRRSDWYREHQLKQGKFPACSGCVVNCYFDPSFHYVLDRLFVSSTFAKLRYAYYKYGKKKKYPVTDAATVFAQSNNRP